MIQKKFIVGNWKMNPGTLAEASALFRKIEKGIVPSKKVIAVACPPFVFLESLGRQKPKNTSKSKSKSIAVPKPGQLFLGAQDVFYESSGAYTGETSPTMLASLGVRYCIVGHSERRAKGETNEIVNKKVLACLKTNIVPIMCVGEKARDDDGNYLVEVKEQVMKGLAGIDRMKLKALIIAYEPIFAVGAARALDPHGVHEMILYIKKLLIDNYRLKSAETAVLYGGAVDTTNAAELITKGNADGFLIGRQSLDAESFLSIFNSAKEVK